jgi:alkylation response protein AidB-like acyl-CoA dehydrogenase
LRVRGARTLHDMTTLEDIRTDSLLDRAATVAPVLAQHASRHDVDGTFVSESLDALRDAGLLAAGVPTELGGLGATNRDLADLQRELAHHCGSTALASSMHQHVVCFTAWRYRRGMPGAEATLRRVAEEGIVLVSTGGGDWTHPRGNAVRVDGGFRVSGTKRFASQSTVGAAMSTMATYDDPEQGRRVLNLAVPFASDGVSISDNWDTLGMRGTASNDVVLEDVFVPDERVLANRPYGVIDPPLQVIGSVAMPIISAVYLGVAETAFAAAVEAARSRADDPTVRRQVGLMRHRLQVAAWTLDGVFDLVGPDPQPSEATLTAVMVAKREIALAGIQVCDLAMEVVGGGAFFRGSVVERCYRDIRAAKFHPTTPEDTLLLAGEQAFMPPGAPS